MSIKHYLSAAAALTMLAACSDYDPGMSNQAVDLTEAEIETIKEYTANFVERYGEMDPNHTWGFGELAEMDEMGTRTMNVNHNLWAVPDSDFPLENIPGYPQAQDDSEYSEKYFVQDGNGYKILDAVEAGQTGYNPAGDVTDEEIAYVSAWFRTHKNPKPNISVNWDSYYVQAISGDKDRTYYGTMENEGKDNWQEVAPEGKTDPCGKWVTQTRVHYVYTEQTDDGTTTTERDEDPESILYTVDYLWAPTSSTGEAEDHVLNFNWQRTNKIDEDNPQTFYQDEENKTGNARTITYVYDAGSQHFSVHNSNALGQNHECVQYDNYVIINLKFEIGGKKYDGYYVAFDYQFYHDQIPEHSWENNGITYTEHKYALRDYDGYYSNYIVKIIPGNGTTTKTVTHKRRVMCEDLGSTFDFDFNDLVFDVVYSRQEQLNASNEWKPVNSDGLWDVTVTLQASGGTLPIYIKDFEGNKYNVHELFGCTQSSGGLYSPVNVGTNYTHAPVTLNFGRTASTNPEDIAILVYSKDAERSATHELALPNPSGSQFLGTSIAPQKICVPTYVRWTKEYQQIEWAYPNFASWVQKEGGTAGFGHENDWTLDSVEQYLFNP